LYKFIIHQKTVEIDSLLNVGDGTLQQELLLLPREGKSLRVAV